MPSEEYKQRKNAYIKRYQQAVYTNISFKVRKKEDGDIINFLNSLPNKSSFLKDLIRKSDAFNGK